MNSSFFGQTSMVLFVSMRDSLAAELMGDPSVGHIERDVGGFGDEVPETGSHDGMALRNRDLNHRSVH